MKRVLVFVASGFSTRMGGAPKALSIVNGNSVIINAIELANPFYDDIFIINNPQTRPLFEAEIYGHGGHAKVRDIITGKGDAESVLKSLVLVEKEIGDHVDATFCWGDAFFASNIPFKFMLDKDIIDIDSILVGCSVDNDPYAYFDIYTEKGDLGKMRIKKSYFKKRDGGIPVGMHDQCIFRCISSKFLSCLEEYRIELGFDGENYLKSPTNEMGLLNSFEFFNNIGKPAQVQIFQSNQVFSFNTQQELADICKNISTKNNETVI